MGEARQRRHADIMVARKQCANDGGNRQRRQAREGSIPPALRREPVDRVDEIARDESGTIGEYAEPGSAGRGNARGQRTRKRTRDGLRPLISIPVDADIGRALKAVDEDHRLIVGLQDAFALRGEPIGQIANHRIVHASDGTLRIRCIARHRAVKVPTIDGQGCSHRRARRVFNCYGAPTAMKVNSVSWSSGVSPPALAVVFTSVVATLNEAAVMSRTVTTLSLFCELIGQAMTIGKPGKATAKST